VKCTVEIRKAAVDDLLRVPLHITRKLEYWVNAVEIYGIEAVRKIPGYHDERLKGKRWMQRSIRLNRAYRAIYTENKSCEICVILIIEVHKRDY